MGTRGCCPRSVAKLLMDLRLHSCWVSGFASTGDECLRIKVHTRSRTNTHIHQEQKCMHRPKPQAHPNLSKPLGRPWGCGGRVSPSPCDSVGGRGGSHALTHPHVLRARGSCTRARTHTAALTAHQDIDSKAHPARGAAERKEREQGEDAPHASA